MPRTERSLLTTIEVGTSMLRLAAIERTDLGPQLVAWAEEPTKGVKAGRIVHMATLSEALRRLRGQAEERAGQPLTDAIVALAGYHAHVVPTVGVAEVRSGEVRRGDLDQVHASMRAGQTPQESRELHLLVRDYHVGHSPGVRAPLGMSAKRLEAYGHVVAGEYATLQTLSRCLSDAGLRATRFVLSGLAAAASALNADERDRDVWVVNVGATTTEVIVMDNGAVVHAGSVAMGGETITMDLAHRLRMGPVEAEKLKRNWGCAHESLVRDGHSIDLPPTPEHALRRIAHVELHRRIAPRAQELFELVRQEALRAGVTELPSAGIVLTGGGALLAGMDLCADEVIGAPVRLGCAIGISGPDEVTGNPRNTTAIGLALQEDGYVAGERTLRMRMEGWFERVF